jgi:hypothetical protein
MTYILTYKQRKIHPQLDKRQFIIPFLAQVETLVIQNLGRRKNTVYPGPPTVPPAENC